jgi:hypothetical protein
MFKMGSHYSFGHLKQNLWLKERSGINCQFDSRPEKDGNRLDLLVCKWPATYRWKDLNEGYNFALDWISIQGLLAKLWGSKIAGVPIWAISGLPLGNPGTKSHLDVGPVERCEYTIRGKVGLPPSPGYGESCVSVLPVARPSTKSAPTSH